MGAGYYLEKIAEKAKERSYENDPDFGYRKPSYTGRKGAYDTFFWKGSEPRTEGPESDSRRLQRVQL